MATYGIAISVPQLTLTLIANIENATKAKYGCKFQLAMQAICKKYTYNHVHGATSLQDIMKELAGADRVHELKDAPAPGTGTVHSVAAVSYLQAMMDADMVWTIRISICCNVQQRFVQRDAQATWIQLQIQITSWQMREGQERCNKAA
jgi:hypothetical protein